MGLLDEPDDLQLLRGRISHSPSSPSAVTLFLSRRFSRVRSATTSLSAVASRRRASSSSEVGARAVSPARRSLPASRKSFDQRWYRFCAIPSRRHSSAMLSSPRRPSNTMRIFSSAEYCLRVARRMSWTTFSAGSLDDRVCCLIFAPVNVTMSQKLSLLQSANSVSRALTADKYRFCAIPSRRHSSAMLSSPRRPSNTMRIFSSAEYCLRVARRMSWTTFSAGSLDDRVCCLIFAPVNVTMSQKLSLLQSANSVSRALTADKYRFCAIPSRRHSSAMLSSPRRPSNTMRIFSSAEYCLRVARRMSWTTFSAGSLDDRVCCLIFAPVNVTMSQKLSLLQSANSVSRALTADNLYRSGGRGAQRSFSRGRLIHPLRPQLRRSPKKLFQRDKKARNKFRAFVISV